MKNVNELDKYKIIKQISTGSASNIYLAIQKNLDRQVVIKELMREFSLHKKLIERFEQEAKIISSLKYDSIIHIYDYWKKGNSYYIVMEYVSGKTLKEIIDQIGRVPLDKGLIIFYEILKGLEYAHAQGIIHRDLKPANIIISEEGRLKILDFGIAHVKEKDLTTPGIILGTYSYMSPEQALGNKVDSRSDIFSLGIVMYELLTGLKPFKKDDKKEVTEKIIKEKQISAKKINPLVSRRINKIIEKCLKKKPKKRFQSMGQIKERLEKFIRKLPLDHPSVLKEFLFNLTPLEQQKTVFDEQNEKRELKQRKKIERIEKIKYFFTKKKLPIPKSVPIITLLGIIFIELELIFVYYLGITFYTQKEWLKAGLIALWYGILWLIKKIKS